MALDGIFLHKIKNEITANALGSRVERVYQPSRDEIVLYLRKRTEAYRLLFSIRADSARVQFVDTTPDNPATPPMLCMLLRKHLCGSVLTSVRQQGLDRVLFFDFDGTNEIGDRTKLSFCAELMGKHSNLILLREDGSVVDALKRVDITTSSYRQILPGIQYKLPPAQIKLSLLDCEVERIAEAVLVCRDKKLSSSILGCLQGASPLLCREIAYRTAGDDCTVSELSLVQRARLFETLAEVRDSIEKEESYMLKEESGKPVDFSSVNVTQYDSKLAVKAYESCSELLSDFYGEKSRLDRMHNRGRELFKLVTGLCEKTAHRLNVQREELSRCDEREKLRLYAELVNANLYRLEKGAMFYDIENYYDNNELVRIPADPSMTPQRVAQRYYKEYRKLQTAEEKLTELIAKGEQELVYLETVLDELTRSETEVDLALVREELVSGGYLKPKSGAKRKPAKAPEPMRFESPDGFTVLVGRNNVQNDKLSLKTARKDDLWLHTQKIPGSHVIVVSEGRTIPDSTIVFAAEVAAWYSKARQSALVPVDYTVVKNLKKPNGAPPGKVIYHVYSTVTVNPVKR